MAKTQVRLSIKRWAFATVVLTADYLFFGTLGVGVVVIATSVVTLSTMFINWLIAD